MPQPPQLEILDLRHFSAAQLRPLLRDEADRWQRRLHWDYTRAAQMLLEYLDGRILPGYVALRDRALTGYAFCVFEAAKAVIGDLYVFNETESTHNPTCDTLLHHLLELLQNTPGVDRIESQLLMFPAGALHGPFLSAGFHSFPRLFMLADVRKIPSTPGLAAGLSPRDSAPSQRGFSPGPSAGPTPLIQSWQPECYEPAAALIHRCYAGHMDSGINDQYRTLSGAQRFLHNIIRFPGCGIFDHEHSLVLRDRTSSAIVGLLLCSRVRSDCAHITQLCIDPALRSHGLGRHLLQHCATQLLARGITHLSLTVTEANLPALRLYEDLGFTTLHRFEAMVWDSSTPRL